MKLSASKLYPATLFLVTGFLGCDAQQQHATSGDRVLKVQDPYWGIVAATITAPANWGVAGLAVHADNCAVADHAIKVNAEAPGELEGIETMPGLKSNWSSAPQVMSQLQAAGCPILKSVKAVDFIRVTILPHIHPGARVLAVEQDPGATQVLTAEQATLNQRNFNAQGMSIRNFADAGRVKIGYEKNGHPVEEYVFAHTNCLVTNRSFNGIPPSTAIECFANNIQLVHAPAGQLEAMIGRPTPVHITLTPDFNQHVSAYYQAKSQAVTQQGDRARRNIDSYNENQSNAIVARGRTQIDQQKAQFDAAMSADKASMDESHQGATQFSKQLGDHADLVDPQTGKTYIGGSNQYQHSYTDNKGTVIQTDSAYAPGSPAIWTELTVKY